MTAFEMPRKDAKLRLDDRILLALREKASEDGISFNSLCESVLFTFAKGAGKIPIDAEPLPEGRGGKREGAGKKKRSATDEEPIASSEVEPIVGAARWQSKPETLFTEGISEG